MFVAPRIGVHLHHSDSKDYYGTTPKRLHSEGVADAHGSPDALIPTELHTIYHSISQMKKNEEKKVPGPMTGREILGRI